MWGENRASDCRAAVRSAAALLRASFYSVLGEWAASRFLRCACAICFPCSSPAEDLSSSRLLGFFYSCSCCSSKTARSLALFLLFCRSELFTPCLRYPLLLRPKLPIRPSHPQYTSTTQNLHLLPAFARSNRKKKRPIFYCWNFCHPETWIFLNM